MTLDGSNHRTETLKRWTEANAEAEAAEKAKRDCLANFMKSNVEYLRLLRDFQEKKRIADELYRAAVR